MNFIKLFKKMDPNIVVIRTIIRVTVLIKLECAESICRHRAKAIAPLISPEYQQTCSSLFLRANSERHMAQKRGSTYTAAKRAIGNTRRMRQAIPKADHCPQMLIMQTPRQANTKASARQPTVSKATTVPLWLSSEMLRQQQWPMMTEHVKSEIIPERLMSSLKRQLEQPVSRIRLVYLIGKRVNDSFFLRKQEMPRPNKTPTAKLKNRRQRNQPKILSIVIKLHYCLGFQFCQSICEVILRDAFVLLKYVVADGPKNDDCHCIVDDALAEQHRVQDGKLFLLNLVTLTRDRAATVSVAQSTALRSITSEAVSSPSNMQWLKRLMQVARTTNESTVPTTPKKLMIPKFQKNRDLRRLQPAAKMIGGKMKVKKISPENQIS